MKMSPPPRIVSTTTRRSRQPVHVITTKTQRNNKQQSSTRERGSIHTFDGTLKAAYGCGAPLMHPKWTCFHSFSKRRLHVMHCALRSIQTNARVCKLVGVYRISYKLYWFESPHMWSELYWLVNVSPVLLRHADFAQGTWQHNLRQRLGGITTARYKLYMRSTIAVHHLATGLCALTAASSALHK